MTHTSERQYENSYPDADRAEVVDDLFGHRVADPYRWLEDVDSQQTQAWLSSQDALAETFLATLPGRERLARRLRQLLAAGVVGVPVWRGQRAFFLRRDGEQQHAVLVVREADGTERTLLDPMDVDPTGTTTLDAWQPDKEGRLVAYQLSTGGDEESLLRVLDVTSGALVDGPIDRTRYSPVAWLPGGEAFYYVRRLPPEELPDSERQYHRRVYLHRLGSDPAEDVVVFGDGEDKTSFYGVTVSRDGRWLVVSRTSGTAPRNDLWIAGLADAALDDSVLEQPGFRVIQRDVDANTGAHVGRDGRLYVFTDRDAPRGRLCVTTPDDPTYETWRDLVPEDAEAVLDGYAVLDGGALADAPRLVVTRTRHAVSELSLHELETGARLQDVALPGLGVVAGLTELPDGGDVAWLGWTDHTTPPRVLRLDGASGGLDVWALPPGTVDVPPVDVRLVTYPSADGTSVRMFVLAPTGEPNRPRPTLLYGYGGFNIPMSPGYTANALAWVEAGGVFAIACLRGGSEEGEEWHRAGMRGNKQNVFDDFIAAAEWLVAEGWTTSQQLAIYGGSNGGLLVGAAATQRPDLYAAVVCSAPLLDMVRYEGSGLGQLWTDEYGSASDAEQLGWLVSYSPYHRVAEGTAYPSVLFTVFDSDSRVDPMHARKMCAALQHATTRPYDEAPIVFRREADVGHGARSIDRTIALSVDILAFAGDRTGLLRDLRP